MKIARRKVHVLFFIRSWIVRTTVAAALLSATGAPAFAAPHAGEAAPGFSIARTTGGTIDLQTYRGRPVYLNFFATWCGPCNAEAPDVGRLYHTYRARGLAVVGIDELENTSKAEQFARQYRWPFAIGVDGDGSLARNYGAIGLPVHVFIDKRGLVSTYRLGEMQASEIEDAIKKIL